MTTRKSTTGERYPAQMPPAATHESAGRKATPHARPARPRKAHTAQVYAARSRPPASATIGIPSAVSQLRLVSPASTAAVATVTPVHVPLADAAGRRGSRHNSVRQRFGELRAALADGWEIVQPIFARPLWSVADDSSTAFNFVLRRDQTTRLLTVPSGRTVERFIQERHLAVDYRS